MILMDSLNRGLNQESIQDMNRTLLINLLRKEGICARAHLAKLSDLKQATVTNIVNDFISWGLVKEVGFLIGSKGRRSIGISINNDDYGILAIRLARKNYSVGIFDLSGVLHESKRVDISKEQVPRDIFNHILCDAKQLVDDTRERKIIAVGMAIPGPYSIKHGRIALMTEVPLWNEIPIEEELYQHFNIPVYMEQDANAGALAQFWHNEADYKNNVLVYIAAGQGIGAGVVINGEVLKGSIGVAGEIGHTTIQYDGPVCACGNRGCLEQYCSSIALTKSVNEALNPKNPYSFREIADMIRNGNKICMEKFRESCDYLAVGLVNIINSFNPAVIVIGDEMAHILPELMLQRVDKIIKERVLSEIFADTKITMSVIKNDSVLHGAAIVAIRDIFNRPERYFSV